MRRIFFLALFLLLSPAPARAADVAMVGDDTGFALLFVHRGNCFAAMPKHVALADRLALSTALPRTRGSATVFLRHPEADLALAHVEGDIAARCQVPWAVLQRDLGPHLFMQQRGVVRLVQLGGKLTDRLEVEVSKITGRFIFVRLTEGLALEEFRQGTSGAVLTLGGQIAGIAIDAGSTREASFLRADELARLLSPHLDAAPARAGGERYRIEAFTPGAGAVTALEGGALAAPWVTAWTGAPIEFELALSDKAPVAVHRLLLSTDTEAPEGPFTPPQRITLAFDIGPPGQPYWRPIGAPDMTPAGQLEVQTGGQMARRIKVRIESVWFPDRPLRLDALHWE